MSRHFNQLTAKQAESLALLVEECAEVQHIIGKILRHGLESYHPNGDGPNRSLLEEELGDLRAAIEVAVSIGMVDEEFIDDARQSKLKRVGEYLHHIKLRTADK